MGDIVLRKDETAASQTYKYARVIKVHVSTDGKVRAADVEYRLPGESVFRVTTQPIHKLVLVIPVEEQAADADQREKENTGTEQPPPQVVTAPEPVQQEVIKAMMATPSITTDTNPVQSERGKLVEVGGNPQEATLQPAKEEKKRQEAAVKCKKVISRKKAGKQTRTIIVSVPKDKEEMVDIRPRAKKRGRPKKVPSVDPPDPR